ncbi:hypothetical protein TSUD_327530 [Trifolium subterraneum]|uniref:Uncharacterized protein n=1 Tax=Trifolium subterraneum TaxID=3900 RepID=A0A2Z6PA19_TRISU|nr:hypothetical protein TSUD_327530 [Trifolium subterraneum]
MNNDVIKGTFMRTRVQHKEGNNKSTNMSRNTHKGVITMEVNDDIMEDDANKLITSEDYQNQYHSGLDNAGERTYNNGSLGHSLTGPQHLTRPPDIVTGSMPLKPILQRITNPVDPDQEVCGGVGGAGGHRKKFR